MPSAGMERGRGAAVGGDIAHVSEGGEFIAEKQGKSFGWNPVCAAPRACYISLVGAGEFQLESLEQSEFLSAAPAVSIASAPRRVADRAGATFSTARNAGTLKTSKQISDFVGAGD